MTITEAQQKVDVWIKDYGVRYFSELTNMAILTEEVGEVARIISRKYGGQSFKKSKARVRLFLHIAAAADFFPKTRSTHLNIQPKWALMFWN